MIPAAKIVIPEPDRKEILKRIKVVLETGQFSQGKNVQEFEEGFRKFTGAKYAVAVSSGGAALESVLRHLRVAGKDVIVPTNTFFATASSVLMAGGKPVLCDIDPHTLSPSLDHIKAALTTMTSGVILVHVGGIITSEIQKIVDWCESEEIWVFEDCAHAHGSVLEDKHAGLFGVAGAYSFFPTKVMTSGEGGMVITNNKDIAQAVQVMRDYGKPEPWVSYHTELGANWRMNELEGAVGVVQLRRLPQLRYYRAAVARWYDDLLCEQIPQVKPIVTQEGSGHNSWYKYVVMLPLGVDRDQVKVEMKKMGVSASGGVYETPLHKQPYFEDVYTGRLFPGAEEFCEHHLCLPLYYQMRKAEAQEVVVALAEALKICSESVVERASV